MLARCQARGKKKYVARMKTRYKKNERLPIKKTSRGRKPPEKRYNGNEGLRVVPMRTRRKSIGSICEAKKLNFGKG